MRLWTCSKNDWWNYFFTLLQILGFVTAIWFCRYDKLPPPGYAVAGLALAAAVMSIHGGMNDLQKAVWLVLIAFLLTIEMRSISKDRWDMQQQGQADHKAQEIAFANIRDNQNATFRSTSEQIQTTLQETDKTMLQTSPKAAISIQRFRLATALKDNRIYPDTKYPFDADILNKGNDVATVTKQLFEVYTGKADDQDTQKQLASKFEKEWKSTKAIKPYTIFVDVPGVTSNFKTFETNDFLGPDRTIYFLIRMEYSDSSGHWGSEDCEAVQIGLGGSFLNWDYGHYCSVFRKARYSIKR